MNTLSLNGTWQLAVLGTEEWMSAQVPGSVMCELIKHGKCEDPFYRDNETIAREWMEKNYEYKREFDIAEKFLKQDKIILRCFGLDTIADIYINDSKVASVRDMHRTYEFDIKNCLKIGRNRISIKFYSAIEYVQKKAKEKPLPVNIVRATDGFAYLRKASNMFGWDSEPEIPDIGIWRDIEIAAYSVARMDTVYIHQEHSEKLVNINVSIPVNIWEEREKIEIKTCLIGPNGEKKEQRQMAEKGINTVSLEIYDPELWWPNGYGKQPLYSFEFYLYAEDTLLDAQKKKIGLRLMKVRKEKDAFGESFEINVNNVPIYAKGADYIPLDKFLPRETPNRMEQLFKDCMEANFTCMRIWGGAIFPNDFFYDMADKYGILIWQDFLFSCTLYPLTDEFEEDIIAETRDNIKRLRHHACLALWCGNNENEWLYDVWSHPRTTETRRDYIRTFEIILADVAKQYDPDRLYYPSSPSSAGFFDNPNGEFAGDIHMWDVWHNAIKPYEAYKEYPSRFTSEFGLQSFPSWKTVKEFTKPEDRSLSSYIMDFHQRNSNGYGNAQIMYYVLQDLPYPSDFEMVVYASQIMQAEGVKFGSEAYRRIRNRCAGSLYWQIGDCWQAPTWASIDYSGRWKALQYRAKQFYAPLLLSIDKEKDNIDLHIVSDEMQKKCGKIVWTLRDSNSNILKQGREMVEIMPLSTKKFISIPITELLEKYDKREIYMEAKLYVDEECVNENYYLFVKPKHFKFSNANVSVKVSETEDSFKILTAVEAFAMYIYLDLKDADCHFSDNYFNLSKGTKVVEVKKDSLSTALKLEEFKKQLQVYTLTDIER